MTLLPDNARDEVAKILESIAAEGMPHSRNLDAALDAIDSIYMEHSKEWQPMHAAPKDGTRILAVWGDEVQIIYWRASPGLRDGGMWQPPSLVVINRIPRGWKSLPEIG